MADDIITLKFGYKGKDFDDPIAGINAFVQDLKLVWDGEAKTAGAVLQDYLTKVAQAVVARNSGAATSANGLALRTGASMASVLRSVKVTGKTWANLSGNIGGNATLAIHEFGGVIKGKGRMLTIPLPAALASGRAPPFARQWANTFVATSKAGNLIIFQKRGASIVPLYVLKDQVTIKARLGLRNELNEQVPYFLGQAMDRIVADVEKQLGSS